MNHIDTMKLALDALENFKNDDIDAVESFEQCETAIAALREALAEKPAQGCEYCNHPLYAGTKCKNCGRVTEQAAIKRDLTPEQPAQQEPLSDAEISAWAERHDINGTPLSLRCMVEDAASLHLTTTPQAQPAQQEPVEDRQERRVEAHNNVYATGVTVDRLHFLARQGLHSEGDTVGWYEAYFAIDRLLELAEQPAQRKPVAWISTGPARMIHWTSDKPAYGDDWIPLYATPLPCPTCEALARTVMMDQTGRDA